MRKKYHASGKLLLSVLLFSKWSKECHMLTDPENILIALHSLKYIFFKLESSLVPEKNLIAL